MKISANFKREEFACKCGCGFDTVDTELLNVAEVIRSHIGAYSPSSACRCKSWNEKIGGSKKSMHLFGRAIDVHYYNPVELYHILDDLYPNKYGLGLYDWGIHIDTRSTNPKRWSS